jgi:cytidylyltransferase family protein
MICALLLGRHGSAGFPGKNMYPVLGRPLMAYPLMAARDARGVDRTYVSTDSAALASIAAHYGATVIDRPAHLASPTALGDHAFAHGYEVIRDTIAGEGASLDLLVLLFANAATITAATIDEAITVMNTQPDLDSAVTVSCYNMWSPVRARRIDANGLLQPFVPFEAFGDPATLTCDRDSQGDVWFADMGLSVVRPHCLERLEDGVLPQRWMGRRIHPIKQWGGLDVDYEWQIPLVEHWLRAHGVDAAREDSYEWARA